MDASDIATPTSGAATPMAVPLTPAKTGFIPLVTVVDFHHARGPEVEMWFGVPEGSDPAAEYDWGLLPFMALSDGAHLSSEDFSYFTLLRPATATGSATSLFGISCTRQLDASQLLNRPADVTRSTVQKAVVVIADTPQHFGMMRERLSVVTQAWFAQREFTDTEILRRFQESLAEEKERGLLSDEESRDQYLGMSLRELVREFRWQTLVLFKCCLLQPKMLFFGSRCERLCMMQFSLISLIPGLIRNLIDCADPELNNYEKRLTPPTSLRTSDRNSLLTYMGLPLQIFGKGSLFGPYTPLQQLDILADFGTKSYIVGSTNSLLLQQKDRYSDILINLDEHSVNITSTSLRNSLALSAADRRWIDYLTQEVNDTWDETNPGRPKTMGYVGSEEFIRLQFEEYILSLVSSVKYHKHLLANPNNPRALLPHIEGDPSLDFGNDFVEAWSRTENHRIWNSITDSHLFDVVEPRHPCAGGLTVDDVQRRIAQQVQDMHLDERIAVGREVLGRNIAAGKEKASTMFNKFYADMEAFRESQRKKAEEQRLAQEAAAAQAEKAVGPTAASAATGATADAGRAQSNVQSAGNKASAYVSSWVTWAGEKRKTGWGGGGASSGVSSGNSNNNTTKSSNGGGGYYSSWGRGSWGSKYKTVTSEKDSASVAGSRLSSSSEATDRNVRQQNEDRQSFRPLTQGSYTESLFSAGSADSTPASPTADRRPQAQGEVKASAAAVEASAPVASVDNHVNGAKMDIKPAAVEVDAPNTPITPTITTTITTNATKENIGQGQKEQLLAASPVHHVDVGESNTLDSIDKDQRGNDKTVDIEDETLADELLHHKTTEEKAVEDNAGENDKAAEDKIIEDKAVNDEAIENKPVNHETVKEKIVEDKAVDDKAIENKATEEKDVKNETVEDETVDDKTVNHNNDKDETVKDKIAEEKVIDDENVEGKTTQDETVEDKAVETKPIPEKVVEEKTIEETKAIIEASEAAKAWGEGI